MIRYGLFLAVVLFAATPAFSQSNSADSQTLQALLQEVRQLRQDIHTIAAASQRAQILLHRIQLQQAVVNGATLRLDASRTRLNEHQESARAIDKEAKLRESQIANMQDPVQRRGLEEELAIFKKALEDVTAQQQDLPGAVQQAEDDLRTEQRKLDDFQAQLDKIEKALGNSGQR